jgi:hypothetical protein
MYLHIVLRAGESRAVARRVLGRLAVCVAADPRKLGVVLARRIALERGALDGVPDTDTAALEAQDKLCSKAAADALVEAGTCSIGSAKAYVRECRIGAGEDVDDDEARYSGRRGVVVSFFCICIYFIYKKLTLKCMEASISPAATRTAIPWPRRRATGPKRRPWRCRERWAIRSARGS